MSGTGVSKDQKLLLRICSDTTLRGGFHTLQLKLETITNSE